MMAAQILPQWDETHASNCSFQCCLLGCVYWFNCVLSYSFSFVTNKRKKSLPHSCIFKMGNSNMPQNRNTPPPPDSPAHAMRSRLGTEPPPPLGALSLAHS